MALSSELIVRFLWKLDFEKIMGVEIIIEILFLMVGLLEIGLSIPLILEKVPPNPWYGFRVKKTFSSEEIWYKANRYLGRDLLVAGLILVISVLMLSMFAGRLSNYTIIWICVALVIIPLLIVVIRGFLYLNKL